MLRSLKVVTQFVIKCSAYQSSLYLQRYGAVSTYHMCFVCSDQIISFYLCIFGHEIPIFTYIYGPSFTTSEMVRWLLLLLLQLGRFATCGKNTVVSDVLVNCFEVVILWYLMYNVDSFVVS